MERQVRSRARSMGMGSYLLLLPCLPATPTIQGTDSGLGALVQQNAFARLDCLITTKDVHGCMVYSNSSLCVAKPHRFRQMYLHTVRVYACMYPSSHSHSYHGTPNNVAACLDNFILPFPYPSIQVRSDSSSAKPVTHARQRLCRSP